MSGSRDTSHGACSLEVLSEDVVTRSPVPNASSYALIRSATSGASSGCAARSVKTSGNELIECVQEGREVRELARRRRARTLAEAVDPDGAETELGRGRDVVIQARG